MLLPLVGGARLTPITGLIKWLSGQHAVVVQQLLNFLLGIAQRALDSILRTSVSSSARDCSKAKLFFVMRRPVKENNR